MEGCGFCDTFIGTYIGAIFGAIFLLVFTVPTCCCCCCCDKGPQKGTILRKLGTFIFLGGAFLGMVISLAAMNGSFMTGSSTQDGTGCRSHLADSGEMTFQHSLNLHAMASHEISEARGAEGEEGPDAYLTIFQKNRFISPTPLHPVFTFALDENAEELRRERLCPIYSDDIPMDHDACQGDGDRCNVKFEGWGPFEDGDTYK